MTDEKQIRDDLSYVRTIVQRAERMDSSASVYFLWAVITFFGYAIIDYEPEMTGFYWMIAGPVGGVLSAILATLSGRRSGQVTEGWADMLHWTGLMVAVLLLVPLVATARLAVEDLPRIILLLVAYGYWTAGVHVDRRMLPVAAVTAALFVLTVFARDLPFLWTITAAGLAASLTAAGLFAAARARRPAA
jgi:hypothetical protein